MYRVLRQMLSIKMVNIILMGGALGLSLLLIVGAPQEILVDSHVGLTTIGVFFFTGPPHTLKFLAVPFFDLFSPTLLRTSKGRGEGWSLIFQIFFLISIGYAAYMASVTNRRYFATKYALQA